MLFEFGYFILFEFGYSWDTIHMIYKWSNPTFADLKFYTPETEKEGSTLLFLNNSQVQSK